ncbi:hypothetical protein [Desulfosporosinus acidiphilus]|uniref:hypothetical protein n=1 Tax=Desulfosporosinus acidiphilus TaxID=885581 RepID=UPI00059CF1FF|nr:hypothetical protein [Desulfosporosinus acidiphilus]
MREHNNIWLSPEELQQMLQGSLLWMDVASRSTSSQIGMRKLGDLTLQSRPIFEETVQLPKTEFFEKSDESRCLEGQPVVWLLASISLLTLSSWFYFVLFAK